MLIHALLATASAAHGDSCIDPLLLDPNTSVVGTTVGRPLEAASTCGTSVTAARTWYELIAPADGTLTLSTCNAATFDTKISVYGGTCAAPTCVDGVDDSTGCNLTSLLEVDLEEGERYTVLVHGFGSATGEYTLTTSFVPAGAMDCTGREPAFCDRIDAMAEQVNLEAGATVVTQTSPKARLRPTALYDRLLPVQEAVRDAGCAVVATSGGTWANGDHTWGGSDRSSFFGDVAAAGSFGGGTWDGAGLVGVVGNRFAVYDRSLKVAGSAGSSAFYAGVYTRTSGAGGIYTSILGQCTGDWVPLLQPWYGQPFPQ